MYDAETRRAALQALRAGESLSSVSRRLGPSRATLRDWQRMPAPLAQRTACPRCTDAQLPEEPYARLLGLYLGDGCLSKHRREVWALRISCDLRYPRLIAEASAALVAVHPDRPVHRTDAVGCAVLCSYWKHWLCLFPQVGAGPKHRRRLRLAEWQEQIVDHQPGAFLRGLFQSDGCRVVNRTTRIVGGEPKGYEYPRYFFANESGDIIRMCQAALDALAVPWRMARPNLLSVAKRDGVAALDRVVGPKG